ncbi:MAG: glycerol-3-phosphate acyltransferase [Candidatus Aminicenantes bacterium]|nr:glycerol-3-phosphate acyltransferase [Candidatus Aminicenantes bacterium]MDH5384869.1 glycerol-3-phosphate acyltransferase [Candidatus Aminicenantes bacterium]
MVVKVFLACVLSYLLGSIPFSYLIAKIVKNVDIRVVGEGNVGGRNVWHVVGKKYGALAGFLDFLKGMAAFGLGYLLGLVPWSIWLCGFFAVVGHCFPVFLKGRGGKGAATAMGFLFAMQPLVIVLSGALMGLTYWIFRNFHISISVGMASIPLLWRFAFGKTWAETAILLSFLLFLGLKRLIDEPYMRKIKTESGW